MPALTVTKSYSDGNVLNESDLDNIKNSLETFFNTTKIDSDNIQDSGVDTDAIADAAITSAKLASGVGIPTGVIMGYGGTSAPSGWLLCDGTAVSRTTYASLFAAISTNFGTGDGATTFNVPDFRGRTMIGTGTGSGLTARSIGDTVGAETLPAHTHSVSGTSGAGSAHSHGPGANTYFVTSDAGGGGSGGGERGLVVPYTAGSQCFISATTTASESAHTHSISLTSGSTGTGSHGAMQPSLTGTFIIKT